LLRNGLARICIALPDAALHDLRTRRPSPDHYEVFADDDHRLHTDVTFSVVESLVGKFKNAEAQTKWAIHWNTTLCCKLAKCSFPHRLFLEGQRKL
jgi:hypothetical protein